MKIISYTAVLATALYASIASADKGFDPKKLTAADGGALSSDVAKKFEKIKTTANFGKGGGKIDLCPSGDCENGQVISLALSRIEEVGADDKLVAKSDNFNKLESEWTAFTAGDIGGVAVVSTSFISEIAIKDQTEKPKFNLTASIFSADGTVKNGDLNVPVSAGNVKFTVSMDAWPFTADANKLKIALTTKAKGKKASATPAPKPATPAPKPATPAPEPATPAPKPATPAPGVAASLVASNAATDTFAVSNAALATDTTTTTTTGSATVLDKPVKAKRKDNEKIERTDFGQGMYMDAPVEAVLDGKNAAITATIDGSGDKIEYVWVFPNYKTSLYYDPVIGSTDASAQVTTDTTGTTTPKPSTATPAPSKSAASGATTLSVMCAAIAGLAVVAFL